MKGCYLLKMSFFLSVGSVSHKRQLLTLICREYQLEAGENSDQSKHIPIHVKLTKYKMKYWNVLEMTPTAKRHSIYDKQSLVVLKKWTRNFGRLSPLTTGIQLSSLSEWWLANMVNIPMCLWCARNILAEHEVLGLYLHAFKLHCIS